MKLSEMAMKIDGEIERADEKQEWGAEQKQKWRLKKAKRRTLEC